MLEVSYAPPPIPTNQFDWCAIDPNEPELWTGYGPTPEAAIEDWHEANIPHYQGAQP